jgi:glycosyltransferase involved in cell wall biosynthesis
MSRTTTAGEVAEALLDLVEDQLEALAAGPLPGLVLPGVLMGHEVGPDVRADLLFTLGHLHTAGRREIAGSEVTSHIVRLLAGVDGRRTHTFYSYRVAETAVRFGRVTDNPVLEALGPVELEQVARAVDSMDWLELLEADVLPRNYAAVLARCEHARRQLGMLDDDTVLESLLGRVRDLLGGHLDDSNTSVGRYDIYTVDVHLFCEPLAELVGDAWWEGTRRALDLVNRVATRDGSAVAWGRSTGALAVCHTIELGGLVARRPLVDDASPWLARAAHAADRVHDWFDGGWVTAHRYRSSDPYRGLDRRLQMTLDCLGKLAEAAHGLQAIASTPIHPDESVLFPERDEMVWFDRPRNAGVWSYRDRSTAFTLPLVGATTTDYLPAPRNPGLWEVPVGSNLATATPLVLHGDRRFAAGGLPVWSEHSLGTLRARYDGFPLAGEFEPGPETPVLRAEREVTWSVEGRTLHVEEHLRFDELPRAIALQVTEAPGRPLDVRFQCGSGHRTARVEVAGVAEYRSCWGELPFVHQVDLDPATEVSFRWSVTPLLRVVSSAVGAAYNDRLYEALEGRVRVAPLTHAAATDPGELSDRLAGADQFHLHWPEWLLIGDLGAHRALIEGIRGAGVPIVWTQHNLVGHDRNPEVPAFYEAWAGAADLVIHHSEWGRDRAIDRYRYGAQTRHVVIPHGLFGEGAPGEDRAGSRAGVEHDLGLRSGVIRLGVVGAPRLDKDVAMVMRAVTRSSRDDLELLVLSLREGEEAPDDPRIVARPYEMVPRADYDRRLGALDALVMPFDPDGEMLTTGTIGDALAHGLPTIASSWGFLTEQLGDAAITYGRTEDDLLRCLEALDRESLAAAGAAAVRRRPSHRWSHIADLTFAELDRLGGTRH